MSHATSSEKRSAPQTPKRHSFRSDGADPIDARPVPSGYYPTHAPPSRRAPEEYYVGRTSDFDARLRAHTAGLSPHTAKHRPSEAPPVCSADDVPTADPS